MVRFQFSSVTRVFRSEISDALAQFSSLRSVNFEYDDGCLTDCSAAAMDDNRCDGQKCPKPSIIKNLHPKIAGVQVPKRPPSVKWCMLKFTSAESREEVKQALHMQQAPNIKGVLMCSIPVNETLSALPESKTGEGLTTKEVIHTLAVHNQVKTPVNVTMDFQINSTERELNVRFGVFSNTPVKRENSSET
ncbi:hypothetical protein ONE63_006939 [Megalurothrips usitatus]|uniref:Uncharacterized protein n=1 Tax=Megalurothrips usitatus TaxID=439358 RepID=A0AAV7XTY1_9NEOP|nr:hypothetical protein ONE63_006939 [Megalurothrips usitatus]